MVEIKRKVSLRQKNTTAVPEPEQKPSVDLKRKVKLKEKQTPQPASETIGQAFPSKQGVPSSPKTPSKSKGKKAFWGILLFILIGLGVYALLNKVNIHKDGPSDKPTLVEHSNAVKEEGVQEGELTEELVPDDSKVGQPSEVEKPATSQNDLMEQNDIEHHQADVSKPSDAKKSPANESLSQTSETNGNYSTNEPDSKAKEKGQDVASDASIANKKEVKVLWESLDQETKEVILGAYGNGKQRIESLGTRYAEIQAKVNAYYGEKYGH